MLQPETRFTIDFADVLQATHETADGRPRGESGRLATETEFDRWARPRAGSRVVHVNGRRLVWLRHFRYRINSAVPFKRICVSAGAADSHVGWGRTRGHCQPRGLRQPFAQMRAAEPRCSLDNGLPMSRRSSPR